MSPAALRHRLQRLRKAWLHLPHTQAIAAAVLPLLLVLWGALWADLRQRDAQLRADYENRIHNVTQVSAQALYGLFLAADQTLLDLREAWARDPAGFADAVQRRRRAGALGIDFDISLIDADGLVSHSSLNPRAVGMHVGNTEHFTAQRDADGLDHFHIGAPVWARMAERWLMPLSRRLPPDASGRFRGVIVLWVAPDYFGRIYRSTHLYPGSVFTLIDLASGSVLLRHHKPGLNRQPADATGRFASDAALVQLHSQPLRMPPAALQTARQLPRTGTGHWASALDAEIRTYAWHRFAGHDLLLMAGEPRAYYQAEAASDRARYLWAGGLLSALIGLTAAVQLAYLRSRTHNARAHERQLRLLQHQQTQLQAQREQLRELGQHLVQVRETERQRIAQDLHDDIGQQLSVLRLDAAQLRSHLAVAAATLEAPPPLQANALAAEAAARRLKAHIDQTIATVRRISEDLRPTALDIGLSAAVHSFCDSLQHRTGLACQLQDRLDPRHPPPGPACATTAYRILQEAASNTLRHAKAQSLSISLGTDGDHLVLSIRDDGIGIHPPPPGDRRHFGLLGMQERALALGGQLHIHSEPGQGTTLTARLPLHPAADRDRDRDRDTDTDSDTDRDTDAPATAA